LTDRRGFWHCTVHATVRERNSDSDFARLSDERTLPAIPLGTDRIHPLTEPNEPFILTH